MASGKGLRLPGTEFESTGNRARSVAAGGPNVGGFKNTTATDIGLGAAVALEAVNKINIERDSVASVKAETEGVTTAEKAMSELDPMAPDYQDKIKQIWGDAGKNALSTSGITTSEVKNDLERRFTRHAAGAELIGIKLRKDAVGKEALMSAGDAMNATAAKIRNDPAGANNYLAEHQADMERLKVGMDPNQLRAFSRKAADEFAKNQVIGYAEKGNFGGARAAIKAQAEHLDTSVITGLSSYVDSKESKARADGDRARTANASTVLLDIEDQFNGKKEIDPNTRERLDQMKARGAISPEHHLMAVKTWNNENQRFQVEAKKNAVAAEQLATGTLSNQENADRGFANQFGNVPFGRIALQGTPEQRAAAITLATSMAAGTGYLPTQMRDLVSNADSITNPQQAGSVAYAAEAMDAIEARAPGKIAGVTLSDTGVVNRVRAEAKRLMHDGIPKDEAYKQAAQTEMPKDKLTLQGEKDLRDLGTDRLKKMNPTNLALEAVTSFAERNIPFIATPDMSAKMGAVYERVFKEAMVSTNGNEERSKALAAKKIQDTYGPTKVGVLDAKQVEQGPGLEEFGVAPGTTGMSGQGKATIQAYPPEKFMNDFPTLSADQRSKLVMAELDVIFKNRGIGPSPSKDLTGAPVVELRADAITADDARAGRKLTYQIFVLRGDLLEPIATANGPLRYRLPTPADVKENPVYMEAERDRLMRDEKARNLDIEVKKPVTDPVADERLKRMRDEGRKAKGNR
jgi:hypothetical protein